MADDDFSTKRCAACGAKKPASEFGWHPFTSDHLQSWCRPCKAVDQALRRRERLEAIRVKADQPYRRREQIRAAGSRYRKSEKGKERQAAWRSENSVRLRALRHSRRAKERAGGTHTAAEIEALYEKQRWRCAICRERLKDDRYEVDHITPISRGGSNLIRNIQLLCKPCNRAKAARDPIEFMQSLGRLV